MVRVLARFSPRLRMALFAVTLSGHLLIPELVAQPAGENAITAETAGLQEPAEILVDRWGVPHIYHKAKVSLEDSLRLQNDVTSIPARRLVKLLASLTSKDEKTQAALDLLNGWEGEVGADSAQAALMEVWMSRQLGGGFLKAVLPKSAAEAIRSPDLSVMRQALEQPESRFVTDQDGSAAGKRDRLLLESLRSASYRMSDFQVTNGASFQMVLDVGDWDNSHNALAAAIEVRLHTWEAGEAK